MRCFRIELHEQYHRVHTGLKVSVSSGAGATAYAQTGARGRKQAAM